MENTVKIVAKNEELALVLAAKELSEDIDKLEILETYEGKKGFFKKSDNSYLIGIKSKEDESQNKFKEETIEEEIEIDSLDDRKKEKIKKAKSWLENILKEFKLEKTTVNVKVTTRHIYLLLEGDEKLGSFIGNKGTTLNSLQYLLGLTVNKKGELKDKFIIDSGEYRKNQEDALKRMTKRTIDRVKKIKKPITLSSMNPYERRIVHTVVGEDNGVKSKSTGKEPNRKVIIFRVEDETEALNRVKRGYKNNKNKYKKRRQVDEEAVKTKISQTYDFEKEFLKENGKDTKLYEQLNED